MTTISKLYEFTNLLTHNLKHLTTYKLSQSKAFCCPEKQSIIESQRWSSQLFHKEMQIIGAGKVFSVGRTKALKLNKSLLIQNTAHYSEKWCSLFTLIVNLTMTVWLATCQSWHPKHYQHNYYYHINCGKRNQIPINISTPLKTYNSTPWLLLYIISSK